MDDGPDTATHRDASPETLAADIRTTRRELAATVEALARRTDVRTRLRDTAGRWRVRARELSETARSRARRLGRKG